VQIVILYLLTKSADVACERVWETFCMIDQSGKHAKAIDQPGPSYPSIYCPMAIVN